MEYTSLGQSAVTFEVLTDVKTFWSFTNGQSYHRTGFLIANLLFFMSEELKSA